MFRFCFHVFTIMFNESKPKAQASPTFLTRLTQNIRSVRLSIKSSKVLNMADDRQLPLFADNQQLTHRSPLSQAVAPFLIHLTSEGKSENTRRSFRSDLNLVSEFLGNDTPLDRINRKRLEEFLHWLEFGRGIPCSRKSYARRVTTLKVFFKWLHDTKIRKDDPAAALVQRSGPAPLQPVLADEEVDHLLRFSDGMRVANKPDTRPYLLFRLLIETGIKKSETVSLTRGSIEDRETDTPQIMVRYKRQNVFKERRLPISHDWLEALDEYLEQYEPDDNLIFDCTPRNLEYVLTDLAKAAGIETKTSFETLRWTCAVRDYRARMDMDNLREKMGLSEISWRETSQKIMKLASIQTTD